MECISYIRRVFIRRYLTVTNGAVRTAVNMRDLPRQIPEPEAAAMPAQLLHGTLHGRPGRLRKETGESVHGNEEFRQRGAKCPGF